MGSLDLNQVKNLLTNEDQIILLLEKVIQEELGEVIGGDVVDALQELVEIDKVGSGEMPSRFLCNDVLRPPLNE